MISQYDFGQSLYFIGHFVDTKQTVKAHILLQTKMHYENFTLMDLQINLNINIGFCCPQAPLA
jgi:hypothetical protein